MVHFIPLIQLSHKYFCLQLEICFSLRTLSSGNNKTESHQAMKENCFSTFANYIIAKCEAIRNYFLVVTNGTRSKRPFGEKEGED